MNSDRPDDAPSVGFVNPQGLASALNVPLSTVYYWTSRGDVPFLKLGRHLRFDLTKVLRHFEERTREEKLACNPFAERLKSKARSLKTEETSQVELRRREF